MGSSDKMNALTLECVRRSLIGQEDTIIFSLIQRSKYPINSPLYNQNLSIVPEFSGSLLQYIVKQTEAIHSQVGRYESPEEHPFFPDNLPLPLVPHNNYPQVLHPAAAAININKTIWDMYFNQLLPLFIAEGDDRDYAPTATSDLQCLQGDDRDYAPAATSDLQCLQGNFDLLKMEDGIQIDQLRKPFPFQGLESLDLLTTEAYDFSQAISRRIHYGKFVAEVKFQEAPEDYGPAIRAQDRDALMKLLTCESVEEMVKGRVEKKARVFGQEVCLSDNDEKEVKYKIGPSVLPRMYEQWIMPLTKLVEVEYLLRRLDY